ncbi:cation diffusion facilitator family transporter [Kiloniella sp. b19]|uniref:cation diffusion facilitator family transporter n=1 Tax=Kiloniella sp. GXU_MW_B19 TaxID=3141326 RepID=UPI0031D373EA
MEAVDRETARLMRLASYASVLVALFLIVLKLGAWWLSGSVSLLTTLVDSLLDGGASVLSLLAIRHALTPADDEHRHGHGKVEGLSALAQSAFVAGSGIFLALQAVERILSPQALKATEAGIWVMVVSIITTFALTRFQLYVVKKTGSLAVEADALHYVGDLLMNVLVIVALVLVAMTGEAMIDGIIALLLSGFVLFYAFRILRKALDMLMDRELPDDERLAIEQDILGHDAVHGVHDLRTRQSGPDRVVQCHIELDGKLSLQETYDIMLSIERLVRERHRVIDMIIFPEPENLKTKWGSRAVPRNDGT